MKIRDLAEADIPASVDLLAEGFPRKTRDYWRAALTVLNRRQSVGSLPKLGLSLEADGAVQGLMLMIPGVRGDVCYCDLSSWYLRPQYRKYAPLLLQRSLRFKGVTFTDCSPAPHVLPIVTKFGFKPYSGGTVLVGLHHALRPGAPVARLGSESLNRIDPALRERIVRHLSLGCEGFLLVADRDGYAEPVLYRTTRLKRTVPAARFVFGRPETLLARSGGLSRALLRHGIAAMLVDWPRDLTPTTGSHLPNYGLRYVRGDRPPPVGDLLDTEIALFGP